MSPGHSLERESGLLTKVTTPSGCPEMRFTFWILSLLRVAPKTRPSRVIYLEAVAHLCKKSKR